MTGTRRGEDTRRRILRAAAAEFAARGYKATTVRRICRSARTNVAAIKYHFGSKEQLYLETFRFLFLDPEVRTFYREELAVHSAEEWERELYAWAHRLLSRFASDLPQDRFRCKIYLHERAYPSKMFPVIYKELFSPIRDRLGRLLRMALPEDVPEEVLHTWVVSTMGQCLVYASGRSPWEMGLIPQAPDHAEWVHSVALHVVESITSRLTFRRGAADADKQPDGRP